jgi:NAD(P)-dependent dehydrogenase (short-subunit alcohol dehydrogenase family)
MAAARIEIPGTTVLVTGAGSGIGRATSLAFAARGARLVCVDLHLDAAEKTAAACEEAGAPSASAHRADVADRTQLAALADEVGVPGVLVNNAGVGMSGRFTDMTQTDWEWIRGVNLDGVINGCAVFGPAMLEAGRGHVVNLSSGLGYTPTATEPGYVTTKAAVLALSQCLRADWAKSGVGVTAICPGVINTPIIDHTRFLGEAGDPERRAKTTKVFRRGHKPEAVANAIVAAVEKDRAIVPVGFEAKAGWWLHRFGPVRVQQAIARQGLR